MANRKLSIGCVLIMGGALTNCGGTMETKGNDGSEQGGAAGSGFVGVPAYGGAVGAQGGYTQGGGLVGAGTPAIGGFVGTCCIGIGGAPGVPIHPGVGVPVIGGTGGDPSVGGAGGADSSWAGDGAVGTAPIGGDDGL